MPIECMDADVVLNRFDARFRAGAEADVMSRSLLTQTGLVTALGLTALAPPAAADPIPTLKIVLQVPDGSLPLHLVLRARSEVERIYQNAGVTITWKGVDSGTDWPETVPASDTSPPGYALVVLSSTFTDKIALATDALGGATGTPEHRGRLAYVFYDRVESIARAYLGRGLFLGNHEIDTVVVLAHAMAHEIGHLLLPHGHSDTGLMRADWNADDLRGAAGGHLNFTPDQAAVIRARLLPYTRPSNADDE
jgi:hypothetical protein